MQRLAKEQIRKIAKLANHGISLNRIAKTIGIRKTTAYYHFLKARGRTFEQLPFATPSQTEAGELLGIFCGDGSFYFEPKRYHYQLRIHTGIDDAYTRHVQALYAKIFRRKFRVKKEHNQFIVETSSKRVYEYMKELLAFEPRVKAFTIRLKTTKAPAAFLRGFIRGLFDTDGTVHAGGKRIRAVFYTISPRLAGQVRRILGTLGIENREYLADKGKHHQLHHISISAASLPKFLKLIKPFKAKQI